MHPDLSTAYPQPYLGLCTGTTQPCQLSTSYPQGFLGYAQVMQELCTGYPQDAASYPPAHPTACLFTGYAQVLHRLSRGSASLIPSLLTGFAQGMHSLLTD